MDRRKCAKLENDVCVCVRQVHILFVSFALYIEIEIETPVVELRKNRGINECQITATLLKFGMREYSLDRLKVIDTQSQVNGMKKRTEMNGKKYVNKLN